MADYPLQPKWAVYYGTVRMDDGTTQTFTAAEVANSYNLGTDPYTAVLINGPSPFHGGIDDPMSEVSFYILKPRTDTLPYPDAHVLYNTTGAEYDDIDFDAHSKDRWTHRQIIEEDPDYL